MHNGETFGHLTYGGICDILGGVRILWLFPLVFLGACEPQIQHPGGEPKVGATSSSEDDGPEVAAGQGDNPDGHQDKPNVIMKDFSLNNVEWSGSGTLKIINEGRVTHAFQVEGNGVEAKAPNVGAGKSMDWAVSLSPGTYNTFCRISNHQERGMKGLLVVR